MNGHDSYPLYCSFITRHNTSDQSVSVAPLIKNYPSYTLPCRSQWPSGLRIRILPGKWLSVYWECCVLSEILCWAAHSSRGVIPCVCVCVMCGVCGVCVVRVWCVYGVCCVCVCGVCVVCVWYVCGVCVWCVWGVYGVCGVCVWYVCGVCEVRLVCVVCV
jgi:hypothetical protein